MVAHDHPDVLLGNDIVALQLGEHTQALTHLRRLLTHAAPGHPHGLALLAELTKGADPLADESALRLALTSQPSHAVLYHALGRLLAAQNRWGEAQQAFFQAMTLVPNNASIRYDLAVSLDHLGQYRAALTHYQEAERLARQGAVSSLPVELLRRRIQALQLATEPQGSQ